MKNKKAIYIAIAVIGVVAFFYYKKKKSESNSSVKAGEVIENGSNVITAKDSAVGADTILAGNIISQPSEANNTVLLQQSVQSIRPVS